MMHLDRVESAGGQLGAVLSAPRTGVAALAPGGPWLATTPALAREVLTDPDRFDFPGDVSRSGDLSGSRGDTRSGHTVFPVVTPEAVARGRAVFEHQWRTELEGHARDRPGEVYDAMRLLRRPVARSTTAAVVPALDDPDRDEVGDLVLDWIDALGPVIAAHRPPRRWSRTRRREEATRTALEERLAAVRSLGQTPQQVATMLAAGIQVPISAGSFLLAWVADHGPGPFDPVHAVWETLRLTPPTWIVARVATRDVELGGEAVPAGAVVFVSPLLLGRLPSLVPAGTDEISGFAPTRWGDPTRRPGAWLPFGAGPHACPGRHLGLAQLTAVAQWSTTVDLALSERVALDQRRGIAPSPCRFTIRPRSPSHDPATRPAGGPGDDTGHRGGV